MYILHLMKDSPHFAYLPGTANLGKLPGMAQKTVGEAMAAMVPKHDIITRQFHQSNMVIIKLNIIIKH